MEQPKISLKVAGLAAISLVFIELVTAGIILPAMPHPLLAVGLARLAEIGAMVFVLCRWSGGPAAIGWQVKTISAGLKKGLAWAAGFGLGSLIFLGGLYILDYNLKHMFQFPARESAAGIFLLFAVGGLISPVAEEIFFRGIIYSYLRNRGIIVAVLGSTLLFAMAHTITSGLTFVQIIGGLLFAVAFELEKNILVPITIHVLGNIAIFAFSLLLLP